MAKTKTIVISQPMDARHVGGVNVMGSGSSSLDNYFSHNDTEPNERSPSGSDGAKLETRGRSDTVPINTRRPGLSWKESFSRLRQKSFSPHSRSRRGSEERHLPESQVNSQAERSDGSPTPLRTRRSTTRLGQSIGLESDSDNSLSVLKIRACQPELASIRPTTASSIYSTATNLEPYNAITTPQRKTAWNEQYLTPLGERKMSEASIRPPQPWAKSKRTDSGTAIDFTDVPVEERPVPFQEIMAIPSLSERLAMYKKTRDYWATADHGLGEWVERAAAPKTIAT
ncbi:hypothetical protein COCMIDRAFT_21301 [Bipolaris oryzae ATCC 44560]|uniref:Uncharacterized protein n=1 Tax=Bipolaris oryzae ATCC 44560 TaxID=930090 RepID=W6ZHI4_COCMI|nr:uncharacterized protein COCMIDRAFT_21301 [Bipolaris oryzae ATCC 44560]EUC51317.1 hypothetical protein COCMIDRAFT_21301 [Bipolaris oryzae ATCC 44560]